MANLFRCTGGTQYNDYSGTTVDAAAVTSDDDYMYAGIPNTGIYDTTSKVRIPNREVLPSVVSKVIDNMIQITKYPYTAPEDGVAKISVAAKLNGYASGMYVHLSVLLNGVQIANTKNYGQSTAVNITKELLAGDVLSISASYTNNSGQSNPTVSTSGTSYFIPYD